MRVIKLCDLSSVGNIQIASLFVMKQSWREGQVFHMRYPRRQSAFLWFSGAKGSFRTEEGTTLSVPKGSLLTRWRRCAMSLPPTSAVCSANTQGSLPPNTARHGASSARRSCFAPLPFRCLPSPTKRTSVSKNDIFASPRHLTGRYFFLCAFVL